MNYQKKNSNKSCLIIHYTFQRLPAEPLLHMYMYFFLPKYNPVWRSAGLHTCTNVHVSYCNFIFCVVNVVVDSGICLYVNVCDTFYSNKLRGTKILFAIQAVTCNGHSEGLNSSIHSLIMAYICLKALMHGYNVHKERTSQQDIINALILHVYTCMCFRATPYIPPLHCACQLFLLISVCRNPVIIPMRERL